MWENSYSIMYSYGSHLNTRKFYCCFVIIENISKTTSASGSKRIKYQICLFWHLESVLGRETEASGKGFIVPSCHSKPFTGESELPSTEHAKRDKIKFSRLLD